MQPRRQSTLLRAVPIALGFVGIVAAIALGTVHGRFLTWHFALGALSVVSLIGGLAWLRDVSWRNWLASGAYSFFVVFSVVMLYLISANRDWRIDLTQNRVHTLSLQTVSVLRNIPRGHRIVIEIFAPPKEHHELERFLDTYQGLSPAVEVSIYNPDQAFEIKDLRGDISAEDGTFFVTAFNREGKLLGRAEGTMRAGENLREHKLTNAIIRATLEDRRSIYFTTGHGERAMDSGDNSLTGLVALIEESIGSVKGLRLMQGELPPDAGTIVIAGPTVDFFDYEVQLLRQYLENGGKMIVLLDPIVRQGTSLPRLTGFLEGYGIFAREEIIVDPLMMTETNSSFTPLVRWSNHEIALATARQPFLMLNARPISGLPRPKEGLEVQAILGTTDQVWTEPVSDIRSTRRPVPPDNPEHVTTSYVALAAVKPTPRGEHGKYMRLIVVGDSDCFTNQYLQQAPVPATFFIQSLNWLRERPDLMQIPPRMLKSTPVNLSLTHVYAVAGIILLLGIALLGGGTAWTLSRRRSR